MKKNLQVHRFPHHGFYRLKGACGFNALASRPYGKAIGKAFQNSSPHQNQRIGWTNLYIAFLFPVLLICLRTSAQTEPDMTQYMFNKMLYNPAAAGLDKDYISITGAGRNMTADYYDNFSSEGDKVYSAFSTYTEGAVQPKTLAEKGRYIGLGLTYFENKYDGVFKIKSFMFSGTYSFPLHIAGDGHLSIGFNAGKSSLTYSALSWIELSPVYQNNTIGCFDAGLGLYYHTDKFFVGLSALHILQPKVTYTEKYPFNGTKNSYIMPRSYFLTAGYNYDIRGNKNAEIQYSLLVKYDEYEVPDHYNYPLQHFGVQTGAIFLYRQRFWGGLYLRSYSISLYSPTVGIVLIKSKKFDTRLSYSYDANTYFPKLGTHELLLNARIKIKS